MGFFKYKVTTLNQFIYRLGNPFYHSTFDQLANDLGLQVSLHIEHVHKYSFFINFKNFVIQFFLTTVYNSNLESKISNKKNPFSSQV